MVKVKRKLLLVVAGFFTILLIGGGYNLASKGKRSPPVSMNTFEKTYKEGKGFSVAQTSDGGYIVAGEAPSFGSGGLDVYLLKTDAKGNKMWEKTFGGKGWDYGHCVAQTSDAGYVIAGFTDSLGGGDVYLVKTDAKGYKIWERSFGGRKMDEGHCVKQTSDGGYIIVGSTQSFGAGGSNVYLIKTDSQGNKLWEKAFKGKYSAEGNSVVQTDDGGYIVVGYTDSPGEEDRDVYVVKTDSNGNKVWEKYFGGSEIDFGESIAQTNDGCYIIVGGTLSFGEGESKVYLVKIDLQGNKIWEKALETEYSASGSFVAKTKDGGYILVGSAGAHGPGLAILIKTDSKGNKVWEKTLESENANVECYSVVQTKDEGYIIAGEKGGYVYLVKTDANGNVKK
jgi:hypothetical protein